MHGIASTLTLGVAASCGAARVQPAPIAAGGAADRCAMIEATFRLDAFRDFACGEAAARDGRILVDVAIDELCSSRVFAIYRDGEPTNTNAVLRLSIGQRDAQTWGFTATFFDPPSSPDDQPTVDGSFDGVTYYCAFIGWLARSNGGWRAFSGL